MSTHTPEPWVIEPWGGIEKDGIFKGNLSVMSGRWSVAIIQGDNEKPVEANARRIVACVNALAGVPTDHIERFNQSSIKDFSRDLSVREELLAALKGVLKVADRATVEFDAAREAIAKAEKP